MRLLKIAPDGGLSQTADMANPPGPYAILSHTWGPVEDEVSVEDLRKGTYGGKIGFAKLRYCAKQAKTDGLDYCWIDTCCIDKSSSAELSEAINSMYQWYENAVVCYVYLSDIERVDQMERSAWFTRGWTLQELIVSCESGITARSMLTYSVSQASTKIAIYNRHWTLLGSKHGLHGRLCKITGLPVRILRGKSPRDCSIAQRMSWAAQRRTTRPEDIAYCLLGLFDINMSMLYGEGSKAFRRLQLEIMQVSNDHSILAWNRLEDDHSQDLLARSPADFRSCTDVVTTDSTDMPEPFSMTNVGLSIALPMRPWAMHTYLAVLECQDQAQDKELMPTWRKETGHSRLGIFLRQTHRKGQFIRVACVGHQPRSFEVKDSRRKGRIPWRKPTGNFESDADLKIGIQRQQTVSVESQEDAKLRTQRVLIRQQANTETDHEEDFLYGFLFRNMLENTVMSSNTQERRTWTDGLTVKAQYGGILGNENNVLIVTLSTGKGGTVAVFDALTTTPSRHAALIAFGFDYDFNPVCRVKTFYTTDEHESSSKEWISTLHNTWPDQWIQTLDSRQVYTTSPDVKVVEIGSQQQYRATLTAEQLALEMDLVVRGDRHHGLCATFHELNFQISIAQGWESKTKKAWIVNVDSLVLDGGVFVQRDQLKEAGLP
jgi:hypothetical protein